MLINSSEREILDEFFRNIRLKNHYNDSSINQLCKIEQILSYLELMHSEVRNYSNKRDLVFIESCAGNSYLSFLAYYYYTAIVHRKITIHCVDKNEKLMMNCADTARSLGFDRMYFYNCDVLDFRISGTVDLVYSLHACDDATDKSIYLGIRNNSKSIMSVSCCQHSIKKQMKVHQYRGLTRHNIFREKLLYMAGDSMRAILLEMAGYRADIFEFVSSRYTDKNIMLRARRSSLHAADDLKKEYEKLKNEFKLHPALEDLMLKLTV